MTTTIMMIITTMTMTTTTMATSPSPIMATTLAHTTTSGDVAGTMYMAAILCTTHALMASSGCRCREGIGFASASSMERTTQLSSQE